MIKSLVNNGPIAIKFDVKPIDVKHDIVFHFSPIKPFRHDSFFRVTWQFKILF